MQQLAVKERASGPSADAAIVADYRRLRASGSGGVRRVAAEHGVTRLYASAAIHRAGAMALAGVFDGASKPTGVHAIDGGERLAQARKAAVLSQRELARQAGVSQALIAMLERITGVGVSREKAERISTTLGADFGELFTDDPPPPELWNARRAEPAERTPRFEVRAAEAHARANRWWTTKQAASHLKVADRTLHAYQERGYIAPIAERKFGTLPFKFWDPEAIRWFARDRWTSDDARTAAYRNPDSVYRRTRARLGSEEAAEAAAGRARARAKRRTQVVEGRKHGQQGGQAGIDGGREGGRPALATREQAAAVWRLRGEGQSYRSIAEAVFGAATYKGRVARILRGPNGALSRNPPSAVP